MKMKQKENNRITYKDSALLRYIGPSKALFVIPGIFGFILLLGIVGSIVRNDITPMAVLLPGLLFLFFTKPLWETYFIYLYTKKECVESHDFAEIEEDFSTARSYFNNKLRMGNQYIYIQSKGQVIQYKNITNTNNTRHFLNGIHIGDSISVEVAEKGEVTLYTMKDSDDIPIVNEIYSIIEEKRFC